MRYSDAPTPYGYDSSPFKCLIVTLDCRSNCFDSLGHSNIGQEYQSCVGNSSQVDQFSEVLVDRYKNPILCTRSFQQSPVSGVRAEGLRFNNVVSVVTQPLRQPSPSAPVSEESHRPATETGASVSPDITVWA